MMLTINYYTCRCIYAWLLLLW